MRPRGFTLIELLIVVAIIGILVAIAMVNFLNAQIRTRIARVEADFRTLATVIEQYRLDNGEYPTTAGQTEVTTPIAYIAAWPKSPFDEPCLQSKSRRRWQPIGRWENRVGAGPTYLLTTDRASNHLGANATNPPINTVDTDGDRRMDDIQADMVYMVGGLLNYSRIQDVPSSVQWNVKSVGPNGKDDRPATVQKDITIYDASNGVRSAGDIIRFGPGWGTFMR